MGWEDVTAEAEEAMTIVDGLSASNVAAVARYCIVALGWEVKESITLADLEATMDAEDNDLEEVTP